MGTSIQAAAAVRIYVPKRGPSVQRVSRGHLQRHHNLAAQQRGRRGTSPVRAQRKATSVGQSGGGARVDHGPGPERPGRRPAAGTRPREGEGRARAKEEVVRRETALTHRATKKKKQRHGHLRQAPESLPHLKMQIKTTEARTHQGLSVDGTRVHSQSRSVQTA